MENQIFGLAMFTDTDKLFLLTREGIAVMTSVVVLLSIIWSN
jgi:hypothetical protein